jgi:hypothetical protein
MTGNGLYYLFMVKLQLVYDCFTHIMLMILPLERAMKTGRAAVLPAVPRRPGEDVPPVRPRAHCVRLLRKAPRRPGGEDHGDVP